MKYFIPVICLFLSACATPPQWLASHFNSMDPCQVGDSGRPYPNFCGASGGRTVIYSTPQGQPLGAPIGYTKNR